VSLDHLGRVVLFVIRSTEAATVRGRKAGVHRVAARAAMWSRRDPFALLGNRIIWAACPAFGLDRSGRGRRDRHRWRCGGVVGPSLHPGNTGPVLDPIHRIGQRSRLRGSSIAAVVIVSQLGPCCDPAARRSIAWAALRCS